MRTSTTMVTMVTQGATPTMAMGDLPNDVRRLEGELQAAVAVEEPQGEVEVGMGAQQEEAEAQEEAGEEGTQQPQHQQQMKLLKLLEMFL